MMSHPHPWERPTTGAPAAMVARIAAQLPELETARLRLRAPRLSDYPVYAGFARPDRGTGLADGPPDLAAWHDFCEMVACWPLRGFGPWTVERRLSGRTIGLVLIAHEFGDPEPELGWLLLPDAEGNGYATEAARAALSHAFGALGYTTLVSYMDADNHRSARVAERLGASRDSELEARLPQGLQVWRHLPGQIQ